MSGFNPGSRREVNSDKGFTDAPIGAGVVGAGQHRQELGATASGGFRISHAEFSRVLRRVGYRVDAIEEITAQLPDPIDVDRDSPVLERYGVTRGRLVELMGGSP
jgi:hypothetical protein